MPFHLIACITDDQRAPIFLTRLLLPAGYSTDDLGQDLRSNFPLLKDARRLCESSVAQRGLPSGGFTITESEQALLPKLPPQLSTYDELVEASEAIEAASIHVFSEGAWHLVHDEGNQVDLNSARLFKLRRTP